jgi:hypothetical protein
MKFTVTYDGLLPSNGNSVDKWRIRKQLHPQLMELWQSHPVLRALEGYSVNYYLSKYLEQRPDVRPESFGIQPSVDKLHYCAPIDVKGIHCCPLVRQSLDLACSLDILFLRKAEPGAVILESGDIDNRLKTLFDGLRMPSPDDVNGSERKEGEVPQPLYCVLQQDAMINDVSVRTDRLLTAPGSHPNVVRLIIEVAVKVMRVHGPNQSLLGD